MTEAVFICRAGRPSRASLYTVATVEVGLTEFHHRRLGPGAFEKLIGAVMASWAVNCGTSCLRRAVLSAWHPGRSRAFHCQVVDSKERGRARVSVISLDRTDRKVTKKDSRRGAPQPALAIPPSRPPASPSRFRSSARCVTVNHLLNRRNVSSPAREPVWARGVDGAEEDPCL